MANTLNATGTDDGKLVRTPFIWALYLVLGLFSFMLTMIGPMVPYLRDEFGMDYTLAGLHQSAFALGMVSMGLTGGIVVRKLGITASIWGGMFDMLAGLLVMVLASGPAMTLGGVFLMSLGGAVTVAAIQTSYANGPQNHRGRMIMESNVSSSIMSMLAPVVLLAGAKTGIGWRLVFPVMLVSVAAVAAFGVPATRKHQKTRDEKADIGGGHLSAGFRRMWVLLFFGVSVEWSIGFWCMSYLLDISGASRELATAGTILLGVSAIIGRFISSHLGTRYTERQRLVVVMVLVLTGFPLYWFRPGIAATFLGLFLAGAGTANFYPLVVAMAMQRATGNAARAASLIPASSGSAIMLAPLLLGRFADAVDIHTALLYIPIGLAIMAVLFVSDLKIYKRESYIDPIPGQR